MWSVGLKISSFKVQQHRCSSTWLIYWRETDNSGDEFLWVCGSSRAQYKRMEETLQTGCYYFWIIKKLNNKVVEQNRHKLLGRSGTLPSNGAPWFRGEANSAQPVWCLCFLPLPLICIHGNLSYCSLIFIHLHWTNNPWSPSFCWRLQKDPGPVESQV